MKQNKCIAGIIILIISLIGSGCFHSSKKHVNVNKIFDSSENIQTQIMEGNELPKSIDDVFRIKSCSLNPGKIKSNNEAAYYVLQFFYSSYRDTFVIYPGDELILTINSRKINLRALSSKIGDKEITAYYDINVLDLIEIGNADSARILVKGRDSQIERKLGRKNIENFKKFTQENILNYDQALKQIDNTSKRKRGFIGVGAGTGKEVLIAYYLNLLSIKAAPELSDFLAIGAGFTSFEYDRYSLSGHSAEPPPLFIYSYLESHEGTINYYSMMYGFTHPSWLGNWSVEAGLALQYYQIVDNNWNKYRGFETQWGIVPEWKYKITKGKAYNKFAIAIFVQAGSFWFSINNKNAWALGLSFPVRF